jgi:hypothetical protein
MENVITNYTTNFMEHLEQARVEAEIRQIEENAIIINDNLYYSHLYTHLGTRVDMICGLKCVYSKELPENTLFALVNLNNLPDNKDEEIARLKEENKRLKEAIFNLNEIARLE